MTRDHWDDSKKRTAESFRVSAAISFGFMQTNVQFNLTLVCDMSYGMIQLNDYSSKITEIQQSSRPNTPTVALISVTGVSKKQLFH